MTAEQFAYWLKGFMEVAQPQTLNSTQIQIIQDHLKLVFDKQTPERSLLGTEPITVPGTPINPIIPVNPYPTPDWTWRPNPYTITCTDSDGYSIHDPNKKIC